jgi:hypothetical protein
MKTGMTVKLTLIHEDGSTEVLTLLNITEIHYNYSDPWGKPHPLGTMVAFESDIERCGCSYPMRKELEFEAILKETI